MRNISVFAVAAIAAAIAWSGAAVADEDDNVAAPAPVTVDNFNSTQFDLGIEVGGVPFNHQAVMAFLSSLPADIEGSVINACQSFMEQPVDAESPTTLGFCAATAG